MIPKCTKIILKVSEIIYEKQVSETIVSLCLNSVMQLYEFIEMFRSLDERGFDDIC